MGEKSFLVTIEGEVKNPGNYQYIKGKKMDDYIKDAGGFTKNASKFQSFIINPDGQTKSMSLFKRSLNVKDGAKIIIPGKNAEESFSATEYVTNLTNIWTDFLQAYLIILSATRL